MPSKPAASSEAVVQAADFLCRSKRPLIIAGGGAADAADEIVALAERLDAPVFMTINARGILPPRHPLALTGNLGMESLQLEVWSSDVILAIGTEFGETEMYPEPRSLRFNGTLIRVDIDPLQLMTSLRSTVPIVADAKLATAAILTNVKQGSAEASGAIRVSAVAKLVTEGLWPSCKTHKRLVDAVSDALADVIVAGDQTEPVYAINQFYQAPQTRSFFNSSTGYGTLGYGLPAAFGAKLGAPHRPVVCFIGDGGLQFSLPELATAVDAGIGAAIIVWNNSSYGEIKDFMAKEGIPQIGVDLFCPDFIGLARGFGCEAIAPTSVGELKAALCASALRDVPTVIEIKANSPFALSLAS